MVIFHSYVSLPEGTSSNCIYIYTWIFERTQIIVRLQDFCSLGRISCEGAGNCHFFTTVVNFGFRTFWADLTLLCVKMCRFFWAKIPRKRAEIPGQIHHNSKMKTWSGKFCLEMVISILKWANLQENGQKSNQNLPWKEICNQWIPRYIYIYLSLYVLLYNNHNWFTEI